MTERFPVPDNERERVQYLHELNVLDSDAEPIFDALVAAAAVVCDCPIALVSLIDADRQWFKANYGLEGTTQIPREQAFCAHAIVDAQMMEVPDAYADRRFSDNALVLNDPAIRFYAGVPLTMPGHIQVGTLCVIDRKARQLSDYQRRILTELGAAASAALLQRRNSAHRILTAVEARQRLDWLYTSIPAMLQSVDPEGRLLHVSNAWLRHLGYERHEVVGRLLTEFMTPESANYATSTVFPSFFGIGRVDDIAYRMVCKDGQTIDVTLSATLQRDENGTPLWSVAFLQDVSAQKRAEHRLTRNFERLRTILVGTQVGTWEWNVQTNEVRFNDRWAEILGYKLTELEPMTQETWVANTHPDDLGAANALIKKHFAGRAEHYDIETRMRHRDGHWVWVHNRGQVAEWDSEGKPLWMMGIHIDITARKLADQALHEQQQSLERTGQMANVGGWMYTLGDATVQLSNQTCRIYDLEPGSRPTVDQSLSYYGPQARARVEAAFRTAIVAGRPWELELPLTTSAGRQIWVHVVGEAVFKNGRAIQLVGAIQDITRRHETEHELQRSRELLQVTLDSIADAVITTDLAGKVQWLNPVAERLTGWSNEEAHQRPLKEVFRLIHEQSREPVDDPVARCLTEGKLQSLADDSVLVARDDTECGIKDSASQIRDRDGNVLGVVLVFHDVSEQRRMSREMGYRATHDALTGLVNRSEFEARLTNVLEQAQIHQRDNALMYIDLDQFKIVNDSCGHTVGDQLLQQLSGIMMTCVRKRDTLARLGGDEFGVILEHCTVEQAERVAQKICDEVSEFRMIHDGKPYRVGTSIGLVPITGSSATVATILQAADSACYAAKEAGRSRVHVWREKDRAIRERQGEMQWASRIEQALDEDRFVLYGQRIVPLGNQSSGLHCEILIRILGDSGELISPGAFLPAAERYHLASRIDRWVVRNTFAWLDEAALMPEAIDTVSINLSGQSIGDQVFHRFLTEMISNARFEVGKLCLEITETAAITNMGAAQRFIGEMRELGIRIALDDFGAGASSFGYLKSLPVHYLKIDGQFIRGLTSDPLDLAAVRCFVDVARVVGIETVAEFVEQEDELAKLIELGIDYGQGYLLHQPEPIGELLRASATPPTLPKTKPSTQVA